MDDKTVHNNKSRPLSSATRRLSQRPATLLLALLISIALWFRSRYGNFFALTGAGEDGDAKPWSWTDITPSRDLEWHSCYDNTLECARLDVPMDWLDPSDDERVVLGVVKLAAKRKEKSLPPVFFNPGGPGVSAVQFLKTHGGGFQVIIGDNQDLIAFDPRGVGVSTPRVDCWGNTQTAQYWQSHALPVIDERPGLAYDAYARASAFSGACEAALNSTGILRHMSTASHARDMLEILSKAGHSKLRYWGTSYGTMLGGAFAALFPDRVERLVSDGNLDYEAYLSLDLASTVAHTDLVFDAFDSSCHKAGPGKCALWEPSPEKVQERRASLLESLKRRPVIIPAWSRETGPSTPQLVTYSAVQRLTHAVSYRPLALFEQMAKVYAALEQGDGLLYYDMVLPYRPGGASCHSTETPVDVPRETFIQGDAFSAILCADVQLRGDTPEEFEAYLGKMQNITRWAGALNAVTRADCAGRTVRAKWELSGEDMRGNTHHPILYIGNIADNITPLPNAYSNSARFPGSAVLVHNAYGHVSFAAPSTCVARYIREYFQEGTLPPPRTECHPDYHLFDAPGEESDEQPDELTSAVRKLWRNMDFGL